jgi:hypothetical protein
MCQVSFESIKVYDGINIPERVNCCWVPVIRDDTLDDIFLQLRLAELPRLPHVEK